MTHPQSQPGNASEALAAMIAEFDDYHYNGCHENGPDCCFAQILLRQAKATLRAAHECSGVQSASDAIPRAPKAENAGWVLDYEWLIRMQNQVEKASGYQITLECVEEVVLRTEALLLSSAECK